MTNRQNMPPLSPKHAEWLETDRGLSVDVCAKFGLMSTTTEIGFPYVRDGNVAFVKWRKIDKSDMRISPSGESLFLYNIDELSSIDATGQTLVITEGEFDTIAVSHTGMFSISVPNGAPQSVSGGDIDPLDDGRFKYLWVGGKLHPDIAKFSRVVIMADNDEPGRALTDELAIRIGRNKIYLVDYPEGCKDANDIILQHGPEVLADVIKAAKPLVPNSLVKFGDLPRTDPVIGLRSGWKHLDRHLKLTFPELVTITGTPGAGKSQWSLAWVSNLARIHNIKTCIIQLEDNVSRNASDLLRYAAAWQREHGEEPQEWVDRRFVTQAPPTDEEDDPITLEWIRDKIEEAALRHGCKIILIDPWNEVEHAFSRNQSETQYTNDALREMKRLGRKYQVAIIIVTHPTKGILGKGLDELTLYEVAGSSAWANKSDHGIIICREDGAIETHVKVAKCKNYSTMGIPGIVTMEFEPKKSIFNCLRSGL